MPKSYLDALSHLFQAADSCNALDYQDITAETLEDHIFSLENSVRDIAQAIESKNTEFRLKREDLRKDLEQKIAELERETSTQRPLKVLKSLNRDYMMARKFKAEQARCPMADQLFTPNRENDKISILFLAADPTDASRLRLGKEFREIDEQLTLANTNRSLKDRVWLRHTHDSLANPIPTG